MFKFLRHTRLVLKLLIAPLSVSILLITLAVLAVYALISDRRAVEEIYELRFKNFAAVSEVYGATLKLRGDTYNILTWLAVDYSKDKVPGRVKAQLELNDRAIMRLEEIVGRAESSEQEKELAGKCVQILREHRKLFQETMDIAVVETGAATIFLGTLDEKTEALDGAISSLLNLEKEAIEGIYQKVRARAAVLLTATLLLSTGAILFAVAVSIFLARMITKPVQRIIEAFGEMANGNLTTRVEIGGTDEIGQLGGYFNQLAEKFNGTIKKVAAGAETVHGSAVELADLSGGMEKGTENLFGRSSGVAKSSGEMSSNMGTAASSFDNWSVNLSQIAAAVEEMTMTVREIAKNAEYARSVTVSAVGASKSSKEGIDKLGVAALEINMVTEAINEIADQTKLLALNATIEAARAGEAGRGFAVVASEIKQLARDASESTVKIRQKVETIQSLVKGTVSEIEGVSGVINDVNSTITGIAAAVSEQHATMEEISRNVAEASQGLEMISGIVSHSAKASVEISTSAKNVNDTASDIASGSAKLRTSAAELERLSENLREEVSQFAL